MSIYGNFSKPMLHTGLLDGSIKDSSSYIYIYCDAICTDTSAIFNLNQKVTIGSMLMTTPKKMSTLKNLTWCKFCHDSLKSRGLEIRTLRISYQNSDEKYLKNK